DSNAGVVVEIGGYGYDGFAQGDHVLNDVENLNGSHFDDSLYGNDGANVLDGGLGTDVLSGSGGDDVLIGGGAGDYLYGGAGNDKVSYAESLAGVAVYLSGGHASGGLAEGDWLANDIENFDGSKFRDVVIGSSVANKIAAGDGDDSVYADRGD